MVTALRSALACAALLLSLPGGTPHAAAAAAEAMPGEPAVTAEERLKRNKISPETHAGNAEFRADQSRALEGDAEAALRVAEMYRRGANGVERDEKRMLQWLLHASSLNHGGASYQLYLYFLEQRLDRDAVFFENRALEQGYRPPPRLDPRRG